MKTKNDNFFARTFQNTKRYGEIISILVAYGFNSILADLNIASTFSFAKKFIPRKNDKPITEYSREERIRLVFEELGPAFIKLGQLLSGRRDIIDDKLVYELEKLTDDVPPFDFEHVKKTVEEDLEKPIEEVFSSFEETPIASASIAQVHKAVTKEGTLVAVKVKRPNVDKIIEIDTDIILQLASIMEQYVLEMKTIRLKDIVGEFRKRIRKELNFANERVNIEKFARNFKKVHTIYIPAVYREYSSKRIICLEYIHGVKISKVMYNDIEGYDAKIIARRGTDLILRQIFDHGFFHADPHPGNIKVLEGNVICFLDFGMMGSISESQKRDLGLMMLGIISRDAGKIRKAIVNITHMEKSINPYQMEMRINEIMEDYLDAPLDEIDINKALAEVVELLVANNLFIPPNLSLMIKALIVIEDIGRVLDPDYRIATHIAPYAKKLLSDRFNPKRMLNDMYLASLEYETLFREFPTDAKSIVNQLKRGDLSVNTEHKGLEPLIERLDRMIYRVVAAIVLAALLVSSSLIVHSDTPPQWNGIPIIGIFGFIVAGVMGFGLILSIFIKGRHN